MMSEPFGKYELRSLAFKAKVGSAAGKAVLLHLVGRASPQGGDIFESKGRMAAHLEMGKRTVQVHINRFVEMGLLKEVRKRPCAKGFTYQYEVDADVLRAMPTVDDGVQEIHPKENRGAGDAPDGVQEMHVRGAGDAPRTSLDLPSELPEEPPVSFRDIPQGKIVPFKVQSFDEEFENIWACYPRKQAKGRAKKAWAKARKQKSLEEIAEPLRQFISLSKETERRFIPLLSTWLNDDRWDDDQSHAVNRPMTGREQIAQISTVNGDSAHKAELTAIFSNVGLLQ